MISVIVYGRNDSRGYGMAKRVAISLNVLATQIDQGAGEILFVDYNTPDHLPTLPELIWDTLTAQTLGRLRVLRVRPAHHARFASLTPLPVIESIARNVALRRSDPRNRWILSTNTDALVAPRGDRPLCAVVADLPDGLYGLPRFELSERSWEGFNRTDPEECVSLAAAWADEACLRETVYGVDEVLFDNPGDFQLAPRATLIEIGGFEEEMLLGWHVDHNLAKRLSFRLGAVRSLAEHFDLYHLGHSRNVVDTHSRHRLQNSTFRFVASVEAADAMHDRARWGLEREAVEEIRFDVVPGEQVRTVCRAIMAPLDGARPASRYTPDSFDTFHYDARPASAHLLDLLSCHSTGTVLAYSGARRGVLDLLRKGLSALGFTKKLLVPSSIADHLGADGLPEIQVGDDVAVLRTADVLIFEFGLDAETPASDPAAVRALDTVAQLLAEAAQGESSRAPEGPARLFIAVNSVHTRFEHLVDETIAVGTSPFATRLRYGPPHRPVGAGTTAPLRAHPEEQAHARGLLRVLADGKAPSADMRLDIAAHATLILEAIRSSADQGEAWADLDRLTERLSAVVHPPADLAGLAFEPGPSPPTLSGPARIASWNEGEWASVARYFSRVRSGWTWERAQILDGIATCFSSGRYARALVVSEHEDQIVNAVAARFGSIDVMDVRELFGEPAVLTSERRFAPELHPAYKVRRVTLGSVQPRMYDVIVLPHASAFKGGVGRLDEVAAPLSAALSPKGLLVVGGEVSLLGRTDAMRPALSAAGKDGFADTFHRFAGLRLKDPGRLALGKEDLALVGTRDQRDRGLPVLGICEDGDVLWPYVWFFEKLSSEPPQPSARSFKSALRDLRLGEQIANLHLGAGAERNGPRIVAGRTMAEGHAIYGPFLALEGGDYRVTLAFSRLAGRRGAPKTTRAVVEVSAGDEILVQETIGLAQSVQPDRTALALDFTLTADPKPLEIRLWTNGHVDFELESAKIARR
ncbi:hypothetical protein [Aquabacter spiritensis]|uniref:Uncharacterized protein n=1 Tax=Aquabacter spiritensis TaxID=933073 RepID=A0A4R3LTY4_9HYPH|nr:hypothetical protein [Aquabacter spiritensis]TCT04012.1 hypothetical protein EDC64_108178 [Aquabacter spiritensis]